MFLSYFHLYKLVKCKISLFGYERNAKQKKNTFQTKVEQVQ